MVTLNNCYYSSLLMLTFVFMLIKLCVTDSVDYCKVESKYCGKRKHIGCDPNYRIRDVNSIPTQKLIIDKEIILNAFNSYRNEAANVSQMRVIQWNDELEQLSSMTIQVTNRYWTEPNHFCTATGMYVV